MYAYTSILFIGDRSSAPRFADHQWGKGPVPFGAHHPEFQDAAKREHASERATLVAQHEEDEHKRAEMMVCVCVLEHVALDMHSS